MSEYAVKARPDVLTMGDQHCITAFRYGESYGEADLFFTIKFNPMWYEIKSNLLEGETAMDRPDLVHRVFCLKVKELVNYIKKNNVLGENIATVIVTEYQKRGLPHAHAIFWNNNKTSPKNPLNVDHIVQLPGSHPNLYKAFSQYLMNNKWVVYYSLLLKYRRQKRVLVVKYLFKYLFKGEPVTGLLMQ